MSKRNLLLASSSNCHPHDYLLHIEDVIRELFQGVDEVLFVPFARPSGLSHDEYTAVAAKGFAKFGLKVRGLHEFADPITAVKNAQGMFTGGGNTFVLLSELYRQELLKPMRNQILEGTPYLGTSAGSNIAGMTIGTSNDMPIVYPPSFAALSIIPLNLNPHFPALPPDPTHKGETREDRIHEFHLYNEQPVIAIREDSALRIQGDSMRLCGTRPAMLFKPQFAPEEIAQDAELSHLL
ncbi:MAG: dipeptidase PepE [Planctomycetota bacterium]